MNAEEITVKERERLVVCASHSPGMERDVDKVFGTTFRAGLARAAALVQDFDPDYIVLFGGDHRRAFRHVVPTFAVALSAGIMAEAGHPAAGLNVPKSRARELAEYLLQDGIDVSVCRDIELDHAFAQPLRDLTGGLDKYPVIPVPVNCATAPLPTAARALALGDAVRRYLDEKGDRVLIIGTGGLSHSPPSLEVDTYDISDEERARIIAEGAAAARKKIKPDWDKVLLDAFDVADRPALAALADDAHAQAGAGANEIRTWLAASAAGGGGPLETLVYEPVEEWITGMAVAISR
ncbi:3-carboxyethylcatechol 2,3-dioxygenase [Rhodococcus oxybenzonivorans]|uniref:3-carboxyethylcatechol 2,3-dioxygenase n=1 Tax=Rhodococcus oxybenzonivorans TaxID=1990687 RepID=UPI002954B9A9|nr:3-carboxyethylcatechol 2,3-dioxygenase [Rhodococcus oxybenzonivorans]MDV7352791.1 3-carboxyethylcatechol 2,3-dioxygenase [Rhodococcus oxybenzonivorans]